MIGGRRRSSVAPVNPIRVHLGQMPTMLCTIVSDLLRQEPDMVVVGRSEPDQDAVAAASEQQADILITQDQAGGAATSLESILRGPLLGVFALSADGRNAAAVNLVRYPVPLDHDPDQGLADAIRRIADELKARPAGEGLQ
jgi:hypothetical protein